MMRSEIVMVQYGDCACCDLLSVWTQGCGCGEGLAAMACSFKGCHTSAYGMRSRGHRKKSRLFVRMSRTRVPIVYRLFRTIP